MVWTPTQTGRFLDVASQDRLHALYHLIAHRGLRRGEAVGIPCTDVDLDDGTITVSQQLIQIGYAIDQGEPKTDAGARIVPSTPTPSPSCALTAPCRTPNARCGATCGWTLAWS
jgi:hypothetical protein